MTYRLDSPRETVAVEDGPTAEVSAVIAWPLAFNATRLYAAYTAATTSPAELSALRDLYAFFVAEAQPVWDIADHRGPIPPTPEGMWRLPLPVALGLIGAWIETFTPPPTAVDELVPPGPVRDVLNRELRKSRRKAV